MAKTIKEIADELKIDKQKLYRFIKKNHINEAHQTNGVMHYDEAVLQLANRHFSKNTTSSDVHQTTSSDAVNDAVFLMLKNELEIKNEQIRELNARLAESNAALVAAHQMAHAAQALHAGTIQHQLTGETDAADQQTEKKKQGFFTRVFGRGNE